jgi:hypothetical protein
MFEDWSGAVVVTNERDVQLAAKVATRFFFKPRLDKAASEQAGEPRFKDVEYVEMHIPGDKNNIVVKPVNRRIKQLYKERYEAWRAGNQDVLNGTPIEHLPGILPSQVEEAKYHRIRTVEQMSDVPDEVLQRLGPGWRSVRERASKYLDKAKSTEVIEEKFKAKLQEKDEQLAAVLKRLEALEGSKTQSVEPKKQQNKAG